MPPTDTGCNNFLCEQMRKRKQNVSYYWLNQLAVCFPSCPEIWDHTFAHTVQSVQTCSDWLLVTVSIQTAVGGVYMFLLIYSHNDDKKNIKKTAVMSEDELDDIGGRGRTGGGAWGQQQSVSANQTTGRMTSGGAKLKVCLSECYLATVLLWPIRAAGPWLERGFNEGRG